MKSHSLIISSVILIFFLPIVVSSQTSCTDYCRDGVYYSGGTYNASARQCDYPHRRTCEYGCDLSGVACLPIAPMEPREPGKCSDYCSNGAYYAGGTYNAGTGLCEYLHKRICESGCNLNGTACAVLTTETPRETPREPPKEPERCPDYCSNGVYYSNGTYDNSTGQCSYASRRTCEYGCNLDGTVCLLEPLKEPPKELTNETPAPTAARQPEPTREPPREVTSVTTAVSPARETPTPTVSRQPSVIEEVKEIIYSKINESILGIKNFSIKTQQGIEVIPDDDEVIIRKGEKEFEASSSFDELLILAVKPSEEIKELEIGVEENRPVYRIKKDANAKLLWIFPIKMEVSSEFDAGNLSLIRENEPWWSFLAVKDKPTEKENLAYKNLTYKKRIIREIDASSLIKKRVVNQTAPACTSGVSYNTTIQEAINAASAGDEIVVCAGQYNENVVVNKSVAVRALNTTYDVTVNASLSSKDAINITANNVNVSWLIVQNTTFCCIGGGTSGGIKVTADYTNILNNTVRFNNYGIYLVHSNNSIISTNTVTNNSGYGVYLNTSSNSTLIGNDVRANTGASAGIRLESSNNGILINNTATSSGTGIRLEYSSRGTLINNTANSNGGIGVYLYYSGSSTLTNNTANSNGGAGFSIVSSNGNNLTSNTATSNGGNGILLASSGNSTLTNNIASSNAQNGIRFDSSGNNTALINNIANSNGWSNPSGAIGILLSYSSSNTLINNTANSNNGTGITIQTSSHNNTLINNNANSNNVAGIIITESNYNTLINNTATNNVNSSGGSGISIGGSSRNTILTSNIVNSNALYGIRIESSSNNTTLTSNTVSLNNIGILLSSSSNTTIYNNYFNNTNNFVFGGTVYTNIWNITKTPGTNIIGGPNLGGNFWALPNYKGFSQTCTDADADGICDTSYSFSSGNKDYLPLSLNFIPAGSATK